MSLKETIMIAIAALAFMLITGVAKANPVLNWFENEKKKIVEYQTKSWAIDSKVQLANTKKSIFNLFKVKRMLHKISKFCDKINSINKMAEDLRVLKYQTPKSKERDFKIQNLIETIQADCLLVSQ